MSKREVIAYAITHAPKGVKGGPYEALRGGYGDPWPTLKGAFQWRGVGNDGPDEEDLELARMMRDDVRALRPDARVIRIVRARPSPSEASAVEVLREVASYPGNGGDLARIQARARAVLAAFVPDPSPAVRAAMRETDAEEALREGVAAKNDAPGIGPRWLAASSRKLSDARAKRVDAVKAYRKDGGK